MVRNRRQISPDIQNRNLADTRISTVLENILKFITLINFSLTDQIETGDALMYVEYLFLIC